MSIIAAYHEAGHVVLAVASKYYSLKCGAHEFVAIGAYGSGDVAIRLNSEKCRRNQKEPIDTDPDIAREAAVIMVGGYVAEQILFEAKERDMQFTPSEECSRPDLNMARDALGEAGIVDINWEEYKGIARLQLDRYWENVRSLAERLLSEPNQRLESYDAEVMVEEQLGLGPA